MWTTRKVIDILENHEIETAALDRQLEQLAVALDADLEEIRSQIFRADEVYYDLCERNSTVLGSAGE